jgi:NADH:ubiquinone oxidoreductase subunit 5 (subunit L)/multisubunit Na+/H+ antiporter MnhA subunit
MIHAATMVSAGVYMVIRIFPILSAGAEHGELTTAMMVMAAIGAFTALFSATIAVAQNDIKRVLAYSTISQLGFMGLPMLSSKRCSSWVPAQSFMGWSTGYCIRVITK